MKLLWSAVVTLVFGLMTQRTNAQCTVATSATLVYDTVVNGSGNDLHTLTFPKFDASLGTLLEVTISTTVNLTYDFRLENLENVRINNYKVRLVREEEISSTSLITPLDNAFQKTYGSYSLGPSNGVPGSGTDYLRVGPTQPMSDVVTDYVVYNTADFMGGGFVDFDYMSSTYSIVFGSLNYSFNANANESMSFELTYHYCSAAQLATVFNMFTATRKNDLISLHWNVGTESPTSSYRVQSSADGRSFRTVETVKANPNVNGRYQAVIPLQAGTMYYRVVLSDHSGDRISAVRIISDGEVSSSNMKIFPNPSRGIAEIVFHSTRRSDYTVDVYTLTGQLAAAYTFNNALQGKVNTRSELRPGIYVAQVRNGKTGVAESLKLVVN